MRSNTDDGAGPNRLGPIGRFARRRPIARRARVGYHVRPDQPQRAGSGQGACTNRSCKEPMPAGTAGSDVAIPAPAPEGAATNQPRATPWGGNYHDPDAFFQHGIARKPGVYRPAQVLDWNRGRGRRHGNLRRRADGRRSAGLGRRASNPPLRSRRRAGALSRPRRRRARQALRQDQDRQLAHPAAAHRHAVGRRTCLERRRQVPRRGPTSPTTFSSAGSRTTGTSASCAGPPATPTATRSTARAARSRASTATAASCATSTTARPPSWPIASAASP